MEILQDTLKHHAGPTPDRLAFRRLTHATPPDLSRWRQRAVLEPRGSCRAEEGTLPGGIVLFILALSLLGAWLVSLSGVFPGGKLAHVLLLVGLMLLLLAFLKGRDSARTRPAPAVRRHSQPMMDITTTASPFPTTTRCVSPAVAGRTAGDVLRASRRRPVQRRGHGDLPAGDRAHLRRAEIRGAGASRATRSRRAPACAAGQPTRPSVLRGTAAFRRRNRSGLRTVGGSAARRRDARRRLGARQALLRGRRQLHRAAVRDRDHGARVDAADHHVRGRRPAACRASRRRHAGGLVGGDPHDRPVARVVHHRTGGDDHLRAATRTPVLRSRAEPAAETEELLEGTAAETGSTVTSTEDEFGYRWLVLGDPDFEDLVVALNTVSVQLQGGGYGDRLLAAVFAFEEKGKPIYFIYNFKRGAFYPFVPAPGDNARDNERELRIKAQLGAELPVRGGHRALVPAVGRAAVGRRRLHCSFNGRVGRAAGSRTSVPSGRPSRRSPRPGRLRCGSGCRPRYGLR